MHNNITKWGLVYAARLPWCSVVCGVVWFVVWPGLAWLGVVARCSVVCYTVLCCAVVMICNWI